MGRNKLSFDEKKQEIKGVVYLTPVEIHRLGGIIKLRSIAKNAVKQAINNEIDAFNIAQNKLNESFKFTTECNDKFKSNVILVKKES